MSYGYMYILKCADGSYYTGSTKYLDKRLAQHQAGKGANHTKKHLPVNLVYYEEFDRIDTAFNREKQVQGWSRKKKEALINKMPENLHHLAKCMNETSHGFGSAQPTDTTNTTDGFGSAQPTDTTNTTDGFGSAQPTDTTNTTDGFGSAQPTSNITDVTNTKNITTITDATDATNATSLTDAERSRSGSVNEIPNGWLETTLGEVCVFQRGFDLPKKDRANGKFPLMVSNGQDGTHKEFKVKAPGIVTGRSGSLGNVFLVKEDFWPLNTTLWIKDFKNNDVDFVYYFLKKIPLERYNSGSGVPTLNRNHIHPLLVKIPKKIEEQKAIANILTAFDDKIENLQAQNKTLEQTAQTIFAAWFGKYQVGDELPEGWRVGKLGEVLKLKSGYAFKSKDFVESSNFKALKIKDLKGNGNVSISQISSIYEDCTKIDRVKYFRLEQGDIVLAMSGNTTGKIGVVPPHSNEIYLNQRVGKFFLNNEEQKSFLYNFLMSGNFEDKILSMGYGSAQPNISPSQIESIDIIFPDNEKQIEYLNISNPIYDKVLMNNSQIQSLKKTRDTLLPKLMSGQLRVNEFKG